MFTSYLECSSDLENLKINEFILSTKEFGKFSKLNPIECMELLSLARKNRRDAKIFFEWDCLQTEDVFQEKINKLQKINLTEFDAIRVAEIGAFHWVLEKTNMPVHLILESGHHNLKGISAWERYGGDRLKRFVLGLELPKEVLTKYTQALKTPCEIQVLGELQLFYSPRSLLKKQLNFSEQDEHNNWYQANANSEESPHRGFTIVENIHGSFMLNPKKQSLLNTLDEVKDCGVKFFRADTRLWDLKLSSFDFSQESLIGECRVRSLFGAILTSTKRTRFL